MAAFFQELLLSEVTAEGPAFCIVTQLLLYIVYILHWILDILYIVCCIILSQQNVQSFVRQALVVRSN